MIAQDRAGSYTVYAIICTVTQKRYIGVSKQINKRKAQHIKTLRAGKHHSSKLQRDWDIHGETAFEFQAIESGINEQESADRESHWIAYFDSQANGYNMNGGGLRKALLLEVLRASGNWMKRGELGLAMFHKLGGGCGFIPQDAKHLAELESEGLVEIATRPLSQRNPSKVWQYRAK